LLKVFKYSIICFLLILGLTVVVNADLSVTNDLEFVNNYVSGPGVNNSIINDGFTYSGNLNITNRAELESYDFLFNMGVKVQEVNNYNQQGFLFSRLKASFKNRDNAALLNIGDTFEYFDQYVLNSSLKGISYRYRPVTDNAITLVLGYDYPRWENIFNEDYQAVSRRTWGINLKNDFQDNFKWGVSLLNTVDEN
jgi:hypothetical protein